MRANEQTRSHSLRAAFGFALSGPHMLGFVPFLTLGGYWAGGESGLIATAILLPLLLAAAGRFSPSFRHLPVQRDDLTNLVMRDGLISWLDLAIPQAAHTGRQTAVIVVSIDDLDPLELRFGREMSDTVLAESAERLKRFIRHDDIMVRFGGAGFAFGLKSVRAPETENLLQMARRLQDAFEDPFSDGSTRTYCSISVGIALTGQVETRNSADLIAAAERAGELASLSGAGSVRVYSEDLRTMPVLNRDAAGEISNALETGEIHAWYQPQLNASDNRIVGFEALARWDHPERGLISPATFLGDIEKAGLSQRLAEVILKQSLSALNAWDAAGFDVPGISINFTGDELRNPRMPDYVRWELDRHSIDPGRLVIDVLESVMSEAAEAVRFPHAEEIVAIGLPDRSGRFRHRPHQSAERAAVQRVPHQDRSLPDRAYRHGRKSAQPGFRRPVIQPASGDRNACRRRRNRRRASGARRAWVRPDSGLCHCPADAAWRNASLAGRTLSARPATARPTGHSGGGITGQWAPATGSIPHQPPARRRNTHRNIAQAPANRENTLTFLASDD